MTKVYDLVIVGAGCVGMAAAYYAVQKGWTVCLVESQGIGSNNRYWSSSYSARQNRLQYNEEYLTRYVVASNQEWADLERNLGVKPETFLMKEGALWFGDKNVTTSEGNIKAANAVITRINSAAQKKNERIESLYMEKLMEGTPDFMKAFKPVNPYPTADSEWDAWSALYQPDGGSVNMEASYTSLLNYVRQHKEKVDIYDNTIIKAHHLDNNIHSFDVIGVVGPKTTPPPKILGKKILLTAGVYTPYFLRDVMGEPYLADNAKDEFVLQEYVASYMKIKPNDQNANKIYQNLPNFYNFIEETKNIEEKGRGQQYSGYGFRYHSWDNNGSTTSKFIKLGTMASRPLDEAALKKATFGPITNQCDPRIVAARKYAQERMNFLEFKDPENKHYPCPIIFYNGRETLLDYLNRTNESVVVQSGGWIGKYYPLLAKTAIMMLDNPSKAQQLRAADDDVLGSFINRTRFPITSRVRNILSNQKSQGKKHFESVIIGAGCSGLYAAHRLNKQKHENPASAAKIGNIGVFELSDRISGRLKSFKFMNTTTPMELGGMRYIPTNHVLVNQIITDLGIPSLNFSMEGDPIQNAARLAFLRNDYYRMNEWSSLQDSGSTLHTAYRTQGPIVGMDSFQIISFSLYMILTAPENVNLLTEVFLNKTSIEIEDERRRMAILGDNVPAQDSYYRQWTNYIFKDPSNDKTYNINLSLRQWNDLKPILLFRFRFPIKDKHVYIGQEPVVIGNTYPLYKFGFQNVIEAQFGHEAYQFVAEQNGYFSNTSNASYLDQTMTYLLDFGNVSYRTLASGFDQINYAIANILLDSRLGLNPNNQGIFLNHKLVDILPLPATNNGPKYELVFQVPLQHALKAIGYRTKLNQLCKKVHNRIQPLGTIVPMQDNPAYGEIRFTTNRLILGMPRKSVTNLYNEVDLLRKSIKDHYTQIFEKQKEVFQSIFQYKTLAELYKIGQSTPALEPNQQAQLARLLEKQRKNFMDPPQGPPLDEKEKKDLNNYSEVNFLRSIQDLTPAQKAFERSKLPRFNDDKPLFPQDLYQLAESTQLMPAMKIVMNFDRSWWNPNIAFNNKYQETYKNTNLISSVEEMRGVSITDLPARQTLYFSSGSDNLLLASYNDMVTTEFWSTLHENFAKVWHPKDQHARNVVSKDTYPDSMDIHPAKEVLVKEILKQLSLMHQTEVKEEWVRECIYQFWGRDPYGAGYHNFNSGYYIPAVMKTMRKPWADQSIHIVGQAYSNETGWVEGAYQTTELLLQEELKLRPLVPDYYAGY